MILPRSIRRVWTYKWTLGYIAVVVTLLLLIRTWEVFG
jgi:hypothetical protein